MSLLSPAQGLRRWPSVTSFFQRGTTPNEIWYALGAQNQTAFGTNAQTVGSLRARIFTVSRTVVLDRIAFEVTTGGAGGSVGRVGIYNVTGLANEYPSSLVVDGGEQDTTSTGVKAATISVTLAPGVYAAAWNFGTAAPTCRIFVAASYPSFVGAPSTMATTNLYLLVASAYGSLPATFPAGGTLQTGASSGHPVVAARFSA